MFSVAHYCQTDLKPLLHPSVVKYHILATKPLGPSLLTRWIHKTGLNLDSNINFDDGEHVLATLNGYWVCWCLQEKTRLLFGLIYQPVDDCLASLCQLQRAATLPRSEQAAMVMYDNGLIKGSFTIIDIYESVHSVRFLMTPSPSPKAYSKMLIFSKSYLLTATCTIYTTHWSFHIYVNIIINKTIDIKTLNFTQRFIAQHWKG